MSDMRLIFSIIQHLKSELPTLSPEAGESIEVAIQCLENAYEVNPENKDLDPGLPLAKIFEDHFKIVEASPAAKAEAEKLKTEGNNLMKDEKFQEALACYTRAIQLDGRNPVYYCNRAAAHSRLNNHLDAIGDSKEALKIEPSYSKAYGRLGLAYSSLKDYQLASINYKKALELEPDNQTYKKNLDINEEELKKMQTTAMNGMFGGMTDGMNFNQLLTNPSLMSMASQLLSDPTMQNVMGSLMSGNVNDNSGSMEALLAAGQRLAQHMQQSNPDLVEQLRRQMNTSGGQDSNPQ